MMQQHNQLRRTTRRQSEGGYLLLAIMLMMAFLVITLTYVVGPRVVQQIKRDREEEMIHRGTEYARAIKKFYKKYGRYPASLDDLDKGQIRFLRKRYKDPLTKDGKWKLLNYGDILTLLNTAAPGTPAAALGQGSSLTPGTVALPVQSPISGGVGLGQQQPFQQQPGTITGGFPVNSDQGRNPEGAPTNSFGNTPPFSLGGGPQGGDQSGSSPFGQNPAGGNQSFGGGAIVGVASTSKDPTIRVYNKKKKYDEWQFIYNPMMDQANVLLRGPYQPTAIGNTNIGTPASQLGGQQQGGFNQQNSGFGQQPGFGQQQLQQPGKNYPPDQNQQQ